MLLLSHVVLNHTHEKYFLKPGLCVDARIKLQRQGWSENMVLHRPLLTRVRGGGGRTGPGFLSRGQQAIFPGNPLWELEGNEGGASSRPYCLLGLEPLSQKLKPCALPPFLMLPLIFQRIPCRFFWRAVTPSFFQTKGAVGGPFQR